MGPPNVPTSMTACIQACVQRLKHPDADIRAFPTKPGKAADTGLWLNRFYSGALELDFSI